MHGRNVSERISVGPVMADGEHTGLIRIRTPTGHGGVFTVEELCTVLYSTEFGCRARRAINESPCPFQVIDQEDLPRG